MNHTTAIKGSAQRVLPPTTVLMLLTNAYEPDPRVRQEALTLIQMGCRVRLLAWDRDHKRPSTECMERVEVDRIFLRSRHGRGTAQLFFYGLLYLQMLWRGWQTSFDVIHCHDLDTLPVGFLLGKLKGKPIVYDSHESFPDMLKGSVHPWVIRMLRWVENLLIRRIDLVITASEKLRRWFRNRGARNAVRVGNWKRLEEFSFSKEQNQKLRQRLGIPPQALVVTCITHLTKERKIEELLQAADQCPEVYVVLGGKGALDSMVQEWAANHPRVIYLGFVPAVEIPAYTCAADVVYYGFDPENPNARFSPPHKLFEALAAGRPLITGNFGEIRAVVRRNYCGIVLPAYTVPAIRDALETMQNRDLWSTYARNAWHAGRTEMNWKNGEEILYRVYSELRLGRLTEESPLHAEGKSTPGFGRTL